MAQRLRKALLMASTTEKALQDQAARDAIQNDLGCNMMVLAGAGAGKTHELIGRMVHCILAGAGEVDHMAAITFTRKAAGEMRGRFYGALRSQKQVAEGREADRIQRALESIDQCFIGTIHSFCGRLLRERPVEARLAPDFAEIEERDEAVLRREIWDRFIQQRFVDGDARLDRLEELGLRTEDLYTFFRQRCVFGDVALKETVADLPDLRPAVEAAMAFIEAAGARVPADLPKGPDPFMDALRRAGNLSANRGLRTDGDRVAFLKLLAGRLEVKVTYWGEGKGYARELRDVLMPDFQAHALEPVLRQWRQYVYGYVRTFVDEAMRHYDGERHAAGKLSFQDLLLKATAVLRDHPGVRQYFQRRYRRLFVDEFQDTDPVQAEMLFYLTGADTEEVDWRKLDPHEGSLFLVGDDKQSIYRFRRADVETFRLVSQRIAETGGKVVHLNTSFRSLGRLCDGFNRAFEPLFEDQAGHYQSAFGRLLKHRPEGLDGHCVRKVSVEKVYRNNRGEIVARDAARIADFIAAAVAGGTDLNGDGEDAVLKRPVSPGDFMILTRTTRYLATYARALEARGLACDIVGGERLGEADEVKALLGMLEAVYMPDNPMPLLGYLRGPFVGLGDDDLYAYRQADGSFCYLSDLPEGLPDALHGRLATAFGRLERISGWLQETPPAAAFERLLKDLGVAAFSAAGEMGSTRAGNLLRLMGLVRAWEDRGMHWGQMVTEMRELADDPEYKVEEMTLEAGQQDVVRLMNLHQAKGLQANVVFLADPADTSSEGREAAFHVSRTGETPFLSMPVRRPRGAFASETIGEPEGWAEDAAEEDRFLQAERLRLLYVAATRARNLLVVSCYPSKPDQGPWSPLYPFLADIPELSAYDAPPLPASEVLPLDWEDQQSSREKRWQAVRQPTYTRRSVTEEISADDEVMFFLEGGMGKAYGSAVHRVLEMAVRGRLPADEAAYIRRALQGAAIDPLLCGQIQDALAAFRASDIWREVRQSAVVYTEVPFAVPAEGKTPGVLRGVIDLVYRVPGGWKLVDYKTDAVSNETDIGAQIAHYAPQIDAYARHWGDLTGEEVVEKGVWLTKTGWWTLV